MSTSALLAIMRPWLTGRPLPTVSRATAITARQHRLGGWLHHLGVPLPQGLAQRCEQDWTHNLAGHMKRLDHLMLAWPHLPPPILFKGADLAEHLYGDGGARAAKDLDLLIESQHAPAARDALSRYAHLTAPSQHERGRHEAPHATGYRIGSILIEIHTAPMPRHRSRLSAAAICARSEPGQIDGMHIRRPNPLDRALLWLANRTKDAFVGDLTDALDGALILRALSDADALRWPEHASQAGLHTARLLAEAQLADLGLWHVDTLSPPQRIALLDLVIPGPRTHRASMPSWTHRQLIKWALAQPTARWAMLRRALRLP